MRVILIAAMAISFAGRLACAASAPLPQEVAAHLKEMDQSCRESGGKPMAPKSTFLISGDLAGNGLTDWAIDEGRFNCNGAWSIFRGSGGSQIYVFVGVPGTGARESFVHGAYGMRLERRIGHDTLWLKVGGKLCGQGGEPSHADPIQCERPLEWNNIVHEFDFAPLSTIRILSPQKQP